MAMAMLLWDKRYYLIPVFFITTIIYLPFLFRRSIKKDERVKVSLDLTVPSKYVPVDISFKEYTDDSKTHIYNPNNIFKAKEKRIITKLEGIELPPIKFSPYKPDLGKFAEEPADGALLALVKHYLAPWSPINSQGLFPKITQRMLAAMELSYKGGSVRIRVANGKLFYRKLVFWKQTYRTQRMAWYLAFLRDLLDTGMIGKDLKVDFILYLGDGPKVAADTLTTDAGFPLFSLRTSLTHLDIPVPDPTAFGSNGNYLWPSEVRRLPWNDRMPRLVFRGRGSCLKMQADNWHFCNRIRAAQLSDESNIDIGIIEWNQLYGSSKTVQDAPKPAEIEESTNVKLAKPLNYLEQSAYKFILDLDGGLGSSRKPGIMTSGSLLFSQDSPWYVHWEPLAIPYRHYLPVSRPLTDLTSQVAYAKSNDNIARVISEQGRLFADKFTSLSSSKLYMKILLYEYSKLLSLDEFAVDEPISFDFCERPVVAEIQAGPMGCSRGWLEYNGKIPIAISDDRSHFS